MSRMTSGRVSTRFSLQPSRAGPPKSSAVRSRCWIIVPIAPSSTRIRSSSNDFSRVVLSFRSPIVVTYVISLPESGKTKTAIRISEARSIARSVFVRGPFAARTSPKADCLEQATVGAPAPVGTSDFAGEHRSVPDAGRKLYSREAALQVELASHGAKVDDFIKESADDQDPGNRDNPEYRPAGLRGGEGGNRGAIYVEQSALSQ